MNNTELTVYMSRAIDQIVTEVLKNTLHHPKETAFLLRYRSGSKKALQKRLAWESRGQHVPSFLISSITNACNLFCKGCYARANGTCCEERSDPLLTAEEWDSIFCQASELGIGFHLLAGGEPLLRREVLLRAAQHPETIFPIFTNGTMLEPSCLELFDRCRNLIPILSIEGNEAETDARRGKGTYSLLHDKMEMLNQRGILYGCSLTVSKNNLNTVTQPGFIQQLAAQGCRIVLFVEYVPVDESTRDSAFGDAERSLLETRQAALREAFPAQLLLSFPGDEKKMGGCLAAGRGFFHINPSGKAEACPFAPYSDRSLKDHSLIEVLNSPFFARLQNEHLTSGEHIGGCSLFEQRRQVEEILTQLS